MNTNRQHCEFSVAGCGNPSYNVYSWKNPCSDWHKNVMCMPNLLRGILWGTESKKGLIPRVDELDEHITNVEEQITNVEEVVNNFTENITKVEQYATTLEEYITNIENIIQAGVKPMIVLTQNGYAELVENEQVNPEAFYFLYEGEEPVNPDNPANGAVRDGILYVDGSVAGGVITISGTVVDGILYITIQEQEEPTEPEPVIQETVLLQLSGSGTSVQNGILYTDGTVSNGVLTVEGTITNN